MKQILVILAVISLFIPGTILADEGNEVVVYTSLNPDETLQYAKAAEAATGLKVKYRRMSTGVVAAKLLAERKNPQADAVWGWGITYLRDFADRGFFVPYLPKDGDKLPAKFRDPNNLWFAQHMYLSAFAVNTEKLKEYNLPMPSSWEDLTKPIYKGHVIMPNPASSGTGFLMVAGMLETLDPDYDKKTVKENKAWDFLEKLDKNMDQYIRSGSRPAKFAAKGECVVGASFIFQVADLKKEGKPVELVLPAEGCAYELGANALLKGAKHPNNAKKFLDWAMSDENMKLMAARKVAVTKPGINPTRKDLPRLNELKLIPMDFEWQSANRGDILITWQDKFLR